MHPRYMQTIAEQAGEPDGLTDWDEEQEIASTAFLEMPCGDEPRTAVD